MHCTETAKDAKPKWSVRAAYWTPTRAFPSPALPWKFTVGEKFPVTQPNRIAGKEQAIKMRDALLEVTDHKSQPVEYCILMLRALRIAAQPPP